MRVTAPLNPNLWRVPKVELKGRCIALLAHRDGERLLPMILGSSLGKLEKN